MNILIYNYKQPEAGGGGVGVYSTNLARALRAAGHRVITMDAGDNYSFFHRNDVRLKAWHDKFDRISVINSPMIAPFYSSWEEFGVYTTDSDLMPIPELLRLKFGEIDVFHFQNIEGLTKAFFLSLRVEFPAARLIYSAHNYSVICPQVDLWFQERQVCVDYRDGRNCTRCFPPRDSSAEMRAGRRRRTVVTFFNEHLPYLVDVKRSVMRFIRRRLTPAAAAMELDASTTERPHDMFTKINAEGPVFPFPTRDGDGKPYKDFRLANIEICAGTFNAVLAVSERTRQVLLERGISPLNVHVSYIGTAHKAIFANAIKITNMGGQLHIAYLGYMRNSKGFYLFLRALEQMPDVFARNIAITVAAKKKEDLAAYERLVRIARRFANFRYFDGFTHRSLDTVLQGVNLGIVPPIWEDNLPQVAIEMVSRGVPVLTSDRGGAQEIADHPDFKFKAGSADALLERIEAFSAGHIPLARFWERQTQIFSMEEHVEDLMQYYAPSTSLNEGTANISQTNEEATAF